MGFPELIIGIEAINPIQTLLTLWIDNVGYLALAGRALFGGGVDPDKYFWLFKTVGSPPDWEEMWNKGMYLLLSNVHKSQSDVLSFNAKRDTQAGVLHSPVSPDLKVQ